jgi:hypothetical protein
MSMLLVLSLSGCSKYSVPEQSAAAALSPEQIQELRKEYPLSTGYPALIDLRDITFQEVLEVSDSVIVAEVAQQMPDFTVNLITDPDSPEGKLAGKQEKLGIGFNTRVFSSFQVKVERVVTGEKVADTINLFYNSSELKGIEPELKAGMKIVAAIKRGVGKEQQGSYSYTRYGLYYVVEGDYVLTAFEGPGAETKDFTRRTNGKSLDNLIAEIQRLKGE